MTNIFRAAFPSGSGGRDGPTPPTSPPNFTTTRVADGCGTKGVARLSSIEPVFASGASTATPATVGREPARPASKPRRGISYQSIFVLMLTPPRTSMLAKVALDHAAELDERLGENRHLIVFGDPRGSEKFGRDLLQRLNLLGVKARSEWQRELDDAGDVDTIATRAIHSCAVAANVVERLPGLLVWTPSIPPSKSAFVAVPAAADNDAELARALLDELESELLSDRVSAQIGSTHFEGPDFAAGACAGVAERLRDAFRSFESDVAVAASLHLSEVEYMILEQLDTLGRAADSRELARLTKKSQNTIASALSRMKQRDLVTSPGSRQGFTPKPKGKKAFERAKRGRA